MSNQEQSPINLRSVPGITKASEMIANGIYSGTLPVRRGEGCERTVRGVVSLLRLKQRYNEFRRREFGGTTGFNIPALDAE